MRVALLLLLAACGVPNGSPCNQPSSLEGAGAGRQLKISPAFCVAENRARICGSAGVDAGAGPFVWGDTNCGACAEANSVVTCQLF